MYFQILKLVLWPKSGADPRILNFARGAVNVISGASKTGKSAVIPIIDYCLASSKCTIPVGTIREACAWFGIVIETKEGQKLLARREPGSAQATSDMFVAIGHTIEIPITCPEKNSTTELVKKMLDSNAGLSQMALGTDPNIGFHARVGFRDLLAFSFQPQYIIANPMALFFGADTSEHRERLKFIFPYALGALTTEMLAAKTEIDHLNQELRRKQSELEVAKRPIARWNADAFAWLKQAAEFGLIAPNTALPTDEVGIAQLLREVATSTVRRAISPIIAVEAVLRGLDELRAAESAASIELAERRRAYKEIQQLVASSTAYGDAILIQRQRLSIADWFRTQTPNDDDPIVALTLSDREKIKSLIAALVGIEIELRSQPKISDTFEKERLRLREAAQEAAARLNDIRDQIKNLEAEAASVEKTMSYRDSIERFKGRIEMVIASIDNTSQSSPIAEEINALSKKLANARLIYSENQVREKTGRALTIVQKIAEEIIPLLDAEWPSAPIKLNIEDLTIKVVHPDREDFLWEIGSGANWLAYHIAVSVALQRYFAAENRPVPGFLVIDQPSQVYFPRGFDDGRSSTTGRSRDEDIAAVRSVFEALAREVLRSKGQLQAIVLDHAGPGIWAGISGIHLIEEWRGDEKLVPVHWLLPKSDNEPGTTT